MDSITWSGLRGEYGLLRLCFDASEKDSFTVFTTVFSKDDESGFESVCTSSSATIDMFWGPKYSDSIQLTTA